MSHKTGLPIVTQKLLESSNCYKKFKRTERKRKKSKSDTNIESRASADTLIDGPEIIDLISDEEIDKTPPRNSMQIKRWKAMLKKLNSKSQMAQCKNESFINRMNKSPNDEKIKSDQSILKV